MTNNFFCRQFCCDFPCRHGKHQTWQKDDVRVGGFGCWLPLKVMTALKYSDIQISRYLSRPVPALDCLFHVREHFAGLVSSNKYAGSPPHPQTAPLHHLPRLLEFFQVKQLHDFVTFHFAGGPEYMQQEPHRNTAWVIVATILVCSVQRKSFQRLSSVVKVICQI